MRIGSSLLILLLIIVVFACFFSAFSPAEFSSIFSGGEFKVRLLDENGNVVQCQRTPLSIAKVPVEYIELSLKYKANSTPITVKFVVEGVTIYYGYGYYQNYKLNKVVYEKEFTKNYIQLAIKTRIKPLIEYLLNIDLERIEGTTLVLKIHAVCDNVESDNILVYLFVKSDGQLYAEKVST